METVDVRHIEKLETVRVFPGGKYVLLLHCKAGVSDHEIELLGQELRERFEKWLDSDETILMLIDSERIGIELKKVSE